MGYEADVYKEAMRWSRSLEKRSSIIQRSSKRLQSSINDRIPDRVHSIVTESVRKMIELALTSSKYIRPIDVEESWNFQKREELVSQRLQEYKGAASWEGAGTGFGGFWLGAVDFPLLLSIKMKFLFDSAQYYGFDVNKYEERVYLLHIFMLAFSSDEERVKVRDIVLNWEEAPVERKEIDWKTLQIEYRDTIDLAKLFQLVPGFGAIVGYVANKRFLEQLGETTMNAYRLRMLKD
ncbi:EcsC family protein [Halobacillus ihumii]|uniref:EcsC family protein n=1 Tax=Halobacillus ihumii TaxID=2686092 RepID=UPI0013D603F7|nr:EcsC family protein [Halobacillus ihumii]